MDSTTTTPAETTRLLNEIDSMFAGIGERTNVVYGIGDHTDVVYVEEIGEWCDRSDVVYVPDRTDVVYVEEIGEWWVRLPDADDDGCGEDDC